MKLKSIAEKIFKTESPDNSGNGLFVTVDELIAQRRYAYEWQLNRLNKFTSQQAGDVKSLFKGRGMEFEEIRSYSFGDDVRDIDWRVTARKQNPYTKLYAEEKDREVYVILDLSATMLFGTKKELKSVTAAKIAARIGWQCLKNKDRFGCVISDGKIPILLKAQNSQANTMLIFKKIADLSQQTLQFFENIQDKNYLKKSIELLQQTIKHRAIVFVISDFAYFEDDTKKVLAQLAKKADVTCVNVFDCLEKMPPKAGEYMAQFLGKQLVFSSAPQSFKQEYTRYFIDKHQKIKDFCLKFHLHYIENSVHLCD